MEALLERFLVEESNRGLWLRDDGVGESVEVEAAEDIWWWSWGCCCWEGGGGQKFERSELMKDSMTNALSSCSGFFCFCFFERTWSFFNIRVFCVFFSQGNFWVYGFARYWVSYCVYGFVSWIYFLFFWIWWRLSLIIGVGFGVC